MRSCALLLVLTLAAPALAAPKPDPWPRWRNHDPASTDQVDHGTWSRFLATYLVTDHSSGVNRVRYGAVTQADRGALGAYLTRLQVVHVSALNRAEQKAYWINLYNAATVKEILDHYPVKSIREIRSGLFSPGPWNKKLLTVEGERVTLNDIEHRILRPLFGDNRVHYAVNCASLGCPDLQPEAFTAANTEALLEIAARGYVNHPRGAHFTEQKLYASSIYDWFQEDFGGSTAGVVAHLRHYAVGDLAARLDGYRGGIEYHYDWSLNE